MLQATQSISGIFLDLEALNAWRTMSNESQTVHDYFAHDHGTSENISPA